MSHPSDVMRPAAANPTIEQPNRKSQMRSTTCYCNPLMSIVPLSMGHIFDHDLERFCLGMMTDESELTGLEKHLLCCPTCVERAEETQDYVDAMRVAGIVLRESESASDQIVSGIEVCRQISEMRDP